MTEQVETLAILYGGIFSYIEDRSTVISYRHSDKFFDYTIGSSHFKDYSKNWRELLYIDVDNNAFVASRQYPNYNEEISKQVRLMLEKIICDKYKLEDKWKNFTTDNAFMFEKYVHDNEDPLHYNDMLHGFKGKMVYNKQLDNLYDISIEVGASPICPVCGVHTITENDRPVCNDCWDKYELWD